MLSGWKRLTDWHRALWISILLLALVVWGFLPSLFHGFVNFDDNVYVYENLHVRRGLTWLGVQWAFTNLDAAFWHPLTWLSLMADNQIYGLRPWGYHLTSLLLHGANTVLLFLLLQRMTNACWRSALVAVLFGLHPLHVESVAWVAERKDVLSTLFWMLTMLMYVRYAEHSGVQSAGSPLATSRVTRRAPLYYALALAFFIGGLMSKTMVVTLPLVLLLLDWWPLQRAELRTQGSWRKGRVKMIGEKIPFFAAAVVFGVITIHGQNKLGTLPTIIELSILRRLQSAVFAYWGYLSQLCWPVDLAIFYPYPAAVSAWRLALGAAALVVVSGLLLRASRKRPYLGLGWMWYLITLLPVSGLVQVSGFSHADRFTYVPLIGIFLAAVWWARDQLRARPGGIVGLWVIGMVLAGLCLLGTRRQLGYWKDGEALFRRALAVTANDSLTRNGLGDALLTKGQVSLAIEQLEEALLLEPAYSEAHNNLGIAFLQDGQPQKSIEHLREAIRLTPGKTQARINLGIALGKEGRLDEAIEELRQALRQAPDNPNAHCTLGDALVAKGQLAEATTEYRQAVQLAPDDAALHHGLGVALGIAGNAPEAINEFQAAITIKPDYPEAHANLGSALLKVERLDEAIGQFKEALRLNPKLPEAHRELGAALGKKGRLDEAIRHFEESLRLEPNSAEARCNLGVALTKQGKLEGAIRQFQQALALQPDYPDAQNHLQTVQQMKLASPAPHP